MVGDEVPGFAPFVRDCDWLVGGLDGLLVELEDADMASENRWLFYTSISNSTTFISYALNINSQHLEYSTWSKNKVCLVHIFITFLCLLRITLFAPVTSYGLKTDIINYKLWLWQIVVYVFLGRTFSMFRRFLHKWHDCTFYLLTN